LPVPGGPWMTRWLSSRAETAATMSPSVVAPGLGTSAPGSRARSRGWSRRSIDSTARNPPPPAPTLAAKRMTAWRRTVSSRGFSGPRSTVSGSGPCLAPRRSVRLRAAMSMATISPAPAPVAAIVGLSPARSLVSCGGKS
ncbi:MAG: hypothetical protein ACK56I_37400, partial [bacterium]